MRQYLFVLTAILFLCLPNAVIQAQENKDFVIALKPDKNPDQMILEKEQLSEYLTKKIGIPVKVIIPTSSAVLLQGLSNESIDLGYLSSVDMVQAMNNNSAEILLAGEIEGKTSYSSIWLVKKEAQYKSISDLKGKSVAFASKTSTSGFLMPLRDLIQQNLLVEKQKPESFFGQGQVWYGSGYVSAVQRLLDGQAEAAAVSDYVFYQNKHLTEEQKSKLKVLQKQGPVPTHILAVRASLKKDLKSKIENALLDLNKENQELRDKVFTSKLVKVKSEEHLKPTVEALNYTNLIQ